MATRLTREDRLVRLVEKTRGRIDAVPETSRSLRHMPKSKLRVLVREAGYERSSDRFLEELGARLRDKKVGFSPELTDPANTPETRIYFFDLNRLNKRFRATRELFKEERDLSRFLWLNKDSLTYAKRNNLRILSRETRIATGATIDLLGVDTKTNELVGFELKAEQGDDRLVGQAAKYMRALKAQAASDGRPGARLLIVTGQPDDDLAELVQIQAQKFGVKTDWLLYRVQFELSEA
ncbi:hypothetical protein MPRF_04770 [Mycolicibacterium parafortuitum]|uniref:DUF91 domain-containing protein n=1 Tax=Mycolicibacterium parafortuitum TaxID=39692 RepID=A0A7I7TWL8_MYCPF|nr:hypothetical protein [Mycolicibacterium parafortuitum]BBY73578.1 hypothetical protein MPRF_04770 [Mycolicibacterium parafortuitum]